MLRIRAVATLLLISFSSGLFALGLGKLDTKSALNEPYEASIPVNGTEDELLGLTIALGSPEQFDRAGIARTAVLLGLTFELVDEEGSEPFIKLSSREPIREPFLNFLLDVNWPTGRLLREYTVLLDPPLYDSTPVMASPSAPSTPAMPEPAGEMPESTPSQDTVTSAASPAVAATASGDLGPIGANDTLWSIASNNLPSDAVSVQQMMVALLRTNPDAFIDGNINLLKKGAVLRFPGADDLGTISRDSALSEVRRQHQIWEDYRAQAGLAPAPRPSGAAAPATASSSSGPPDEGGDPDARLELVAPGGATAASGSSDASEAAGSDLLSEALDAKSQENDELLAKLTEAEEIIDLLQRQLNLRDDELAELQARLRELGVEAEVSAPIEMPAEAGDAATEVEELVQQPESEIVDEPAVMEPEPEAVEPEATDEQSVAELDQAETSTPLELAPEPVPAFPLNLVPQSIAGLVPGGALTILGVVGLILFVLFVLVVQALVKSFAARKVEVADEPESVSVAASEDITDTATPEDDDGDSEAITEIGDDDSDAFEEEDSTVVAAAEATEEAEEPEDDPLEEVNVYLAYERFDQAEELVKKVIAENPDVHQYKARLLEVYYSANDKPSYEATAKELYDAVGEDDPLWQTAVAMWSEMSPERALFEEGGEAEPGEATADDAKAFVDITADEGGDDDGDLDFDIGASDDSGDDDVLDLTATAETPDVGGDADADGSAGDADIIDLTATTDADSVEQTLAAESTDEILDLTSTEEIEQAATSNEGDDVFDLTSTEEIEQAASADSDDVLDLTGGDDSDDVLDLTGSDAGGEDVLDLTGTVDEPAGTADEGDDGLDFDLRDTAEISGEVAALSDGGGDEDVLDITGEGGGDDAGGDLLDITGGSDDVVELGDDEDGGDLLDVTKTGDLSSVVDEDLLNVTSPGMGNEAELELDDAPAEEETPSVDLDITTEAEGDDLDFDISDTVAPAFDSGDESADAADAGDDDGDLDFDIGGLADTSDGSDTIQRDGAETMTSLDLNQASSDSGPSIDADADVDLTLETEAQTIDVTSSLDDDSTLNVVEETNDAGGLEITLSSTAPGIGDDDDGVGELDIELGLDGDSDMDGLGADDALDITGGDDDASLDELTVDMDDLGAGDDVLDITAGDAGDHLDTLILDEDEDADEDGADKTIVMPQADNVEMQSADDEADTKLNLAKAYIELGDKDGARTILQEVQSDGTDAQKAEASDLLGQL
ncbi:MAG: FimV/HubP family polar landmark protein [Pseudomonadota bacterium]